jgi:hypothetical protein
MNVHGFAYFMEGLQNVTYNVFTASDSVIGNSVMSVAVALCMTEYANVFIM